MCGRYTLTADSETLTKRFGLGHLPPGLTPRYNIAPSQEALVIVRHAAGPAGVLMRWGLVPAWAGGDRGRSDGLINARAETAAAKPAFRTAFRHRRCLVPADGFFEWRAAQRKTPFYFRMRDGAPFALAGLWEPGPDGSPGFAILTTAANSLVRPIHARMPAILSPEGERVWLDPRVQEPAVLLPLLGAVTEEALEAYEVSPLVNSPRHDVPACVQPCVQTRPTQCGCRTPLSAHASPEAGGPGQPEGRVQPR